MADLFMSIDTDGDGYLSPEELRNGLSEVCGALQLQTTDIKEMIKAMDTDGNGQIDFQEFITAASNREKLINERSMEQLFKMFDSDGDGFIDMSELKNAFQGCYVNFDSDDEAVWE